MIRATRNAASASIRRLLAALTLAVSLQAGCRSKPPPPPPAEPPNIVLISVDTLRADHLGCYGYFRETSPAVDDLADEAVLFENAFCPMAMTLPSHASMFTGLYPIEHGILANVSYGGKAFGWNARVRSVTELLREDGYRTAGFISAVPLRRASGMQQGFDTYDEPAKARRPAGETTDRALAWLDTNADDRFFMFVHFFDPHRRREPPEPYRSMFTTDDELDRELKTRGAADFVPESLCNWAADARKEMNLYDATVRYCDDQCGRLFDKLREKGVWDRTIIIFTSDHGEGLNQHNWTQHCGTRNEQLHVPLLIKFAGGRGGFQPTFAPAVSLVDLFPTVLPRIPGTPAVALLDQATGVDALAADFRERPVFAQRSGRDCGEGHGPPLTMMNREWKYFHSPNAIDLLFNRISDRHELSDVLARHNDVATALRRALDESIRTQTERAGALQSGEGREQTPVDSDVLRQLAALGYVDALPARGTDTQPTTQPASVEELGDGEHE